MKRAARNALAAMAWIGIVLFGAMVLAHWAACEDDDRVCAFTGTPR